MNVRTISWILYLVGSLLVFGSWINIVPAGLGWIGWLMALIGWGVGSIPQKQRRPAIIESRADELSKLDLLRREGVISEEEFQSEKRRILTERADQ